MPQMSPMMWMTLYINFILMLMIMSMIIYTFYIVKNNKKNFKFNNIKKNWKW